MPTLKKNHTDLINNLTLYFKSVCGAPMGGVEAANQTQNCKKGNEDRDK